MLHTETQRFRARRAFAFCAVLLSGGALAAGADTATVALDSGTVIPVKLNDTLSSADSNKGDTFSATLKPDTNGNTGTDYAGLPAGTKLYGYVRDVKAKADNNPGMLDLAFDRIRLPDGRDVTIKGALIGLDTNSVTHSSDGRLIAKAQHKNDRLTYLGYGAAAGLIVGALTKHTLEDTIIGGGLGYLFGSLDKNGASQARDVSLKPGADLGVRLDNNITFSRVANAASGTFRNGETTQYHKAPIITKAPVITNEPILTDPNLNNVPDAGIGVLVNDSNVTFASSAKPLVSKGIVLVPAGPVLDSASVRYHFDSVRQELRASGPNGIVRVAQNSRIAVLGGTRYRLEAPARRINGAFYVPMKFIALATGQDVTWDDASQTVVIAPR